MLSLRDCLDYCDLTEEDVDVLAEHEHLPHDVAAHVACGLVQTPDGIVLIDHVMEDLIEQARHSGLLDKAEHVSHVYARFKATHPLAH
ncbi:hypothetical protein GCM10025771_40190 [Niveibacterium umoris]|uniref:Uncharacterized protein n=1 Tax=Niveibacterium umoris TaxID=1193620 RepID=A0A840BGH8_9RHOO|nr:hypothetical protein [Niveibacterium umoris]MBB4010778.1 hypothetical protein [Niveibacterium umoris]